jgi:hypothetical protein
MPTLPRLRLLLAAIAAFTLSSCGYDNSPVDYPPLSFVRYQPIYLNVSSIEYAPEYRSPMRSPNVEHLMPYSPEDALRVWMKDRIRAVGPDKILQVIVKDGSVVASQIHKDNSIEDFFTVDQDRRYDGILDLELRIYGDKSALSEANVQVRVTRSFTMSENASVARRQAAFRQMIGEMMEQVNAELEKNIYQYMGNHINYSYNP